MSEVLEEKVRHEIAVMGKEGDTKTIWDPDNAEEVENARAVFERFKAKGYAIFRADKKGEKGEQIKKFDPDAAKMICVPPIVGG